MRTGMPGLVAAALLASGAIASAQPQPAAPAAATGQPAPVLVFAGRESYTVNNRQFIRYWFDVLNKWQYDDALFAASPALPPCGNNTNASRTWLDFYQEGGRRIYGFCALGRRADLGMIWFSMPPEQAPPARVYVELRDRLTNTLYRSAPVAISR